MCCVSMLVTMCIVKGFPNGAPTLACEDGTDLVPSHFFPSSSNPFPYVVDISHFVGQTYVPDQLYNSKNGFIYIIIGFNIYMYV